MKYKLIKNDQRWPEVDIIRNEKKVGGRYSFKAHPVNYINLYYVEGKNDHTHVNKFVLGIPFD